MMMTQHDDTTASRPNAGEAEVDDASTKRRCIVSGASLPTSSMIRFVVGPDNGVVLDVSEKLPGRGLWLSADRNMLNTAAHKGAFARAARRGVSVPDDLTDMVEERLVRRCQEIIGLGRRAGIAFGGLAKVEKAIKTSSAQGLGIGLIAHDSGRDGRRRFAAVGRAVPVRDTLSASELGLPFQRPGVTHAYIGPGQLADTLKRSMDRLAGVRGVQDSDMSADTHDNGVVNDNQ